MNLHSYLHFLCRQAKFLIPFSSHFIRFTSNSAEVFCLFRKSLVNVMRVEELNSTSKSLSSEFFGKIFIPVLFSTCCSVLPIFTADQHKAL